MSVYKSNSLFGNESVIDTLIYDLRLSTNLEKSKEIVNRLQSQSESESGPNYINTYYTLLNRSLLSFKLDDKDQVSLLLENGADPNLGEDHNKPLYILVYNIQHTIEQIQTTQKPELYNKLNEQFDILKLLLDNGLGSTRTVGFESDVKRLYESFITEYKDSSFLLYKETGDRFISLIKNYGFIKDIEITNIPTLEFFHDIYNTMIEEDNKNIIVYEKLFQDLINSKKTINDLNDFFASLTTIIINKLQNYSNFKEINVYIKIKKPLHENDIDYPVIYLSLNTNKETFIVSIIDIRSDLRGKGILSKQIIPMIETIAISLKKNLKIENIVNPIITTKLTSLHYKKITKHNEISMIKSFK